MPIKTTSLFAGCGGMDLGFIQEGFQICWANDIDPPSCATHFLNLGTDIHCSDLRAAPLDTIPDADIIICGPPCQGFSNVGKRNPTDDRNSLLLEVIRVVKKKHPSILIIENVKGLLSFQDGRLLNQALDSLHDLGYTAEYGILNAKEYGVAQNRERLFIIANLFGVSNCFEHLCSSKSSEINTLQNAIGDLEHFSNVPNHVTVSPANRTHQLIMARIGQGQKLCNTRLGHRSVHTWEIPEAFGSATHPEIMTLRSIAKHRRLKKYKKDQSWNDASPLTFDEIRHVSDGHCNELVLKNLIKKGYLTEKAPGFFDLKHTFNGKFRRLDYNQPSEAVLTNFGSVRNYIHPRFNRPLSVRECARIHGFPDNFVFAGSASAQYTQVGNAVPPPLARVIARQVKQIINCGHIVIGEAASTPFPRGISQIVQILESTYGSPDLGNKSDPVEELLFIYISQRTFQRAYIDAYDRLRTDYPSLDDLANASPSDIAHLLVSSGLAHQKAITIHEALAKIRADFGSITLDSLKTMDSTSQLNYLLTLPRVGLKTAYCIMLYCFGTPVLPIDANVRRVCQRLGFLSPENNPKKEHDILHLLISPGHRYSFHVNSLCLGRAICLPNHPRCGDCCIRDHCLSSKAATRKAAK